MIRITLIAAAFIAVIGVNVSLWIVSCPTDSLSAAGPALMAPARFDTTGGQEMRPRWNLDGGQGDDATDK